MAQELIYTSVPRGLSPDSSGFCTVACTSGMHPLAERALVELSGYRHTFLPGDDRAKLNPISFLYAVRRVSGRDLHIVSRISDCEVDYTGRSNLIAHHIEIGENELPLCGPATIFLQPNVFETAWHGEPRYLPPKTLPNLPRLVAQRCVAWEQMTGDAGWGGVVAEAAEDGRSISLLFEHGTDLLPLVAEALALLPPAKRWDVTFSTFFMKSQEPPGANKIQIKGILADGPEMSYARLTPQTLCLDLCEPLGDAPSGAYVETARTGIVAKFVSVPKLVDDALKPPVLELAGTTSVPGRIDVPIPTRRPIRFRIGRKTKSDTSSVTMQPRDKIRRWIYFALLVCVVGVVATWIFQLTSSNKTATPPAPIPAENPEPPREPEPTQEEEAAKAEENAQVKVAEEERARIAEEAAKAEEARIAAEAAEAAKAEEARAEEARKARADAEAAEKARKAAEIKVVLDSLPTVWKNLPLERGRKYESSELIQDTLTDSDSLLTLPNWQSRVKLELVIPFDLTGTPIKVVVSDPQHLEVTLEKSNTTIAVIEINDEKGVQFAWRPAALEVQNNTDRAILNSLLLSTLRITIDDQPKDVVLFEPLTITMSNRNKSLLSWGEKFCLLPSDSTKPPHQFAFGRGAVEQMAIVNPQFVSIDKLEIVDAEPRQRPPKGPQQPQHHEPWRSSNAFPNVARILIQEKNDKLLTKPAFGWLMLVSEWTNIVVTVQFDEWKAMVDFRASAQSELDKLNARIGNLNGELPPLHNQRADHMKQIAGWEREIIRIGNSDPKKVKDIHGKIKEFTDKITGARNVIFELDDKQIVPKEAELAKCQAAKKANEKTKSDNAKRIAPIEKLQSEPLTFSLVWQRENGEQIVLLKAEGVVEPSNEPMSEGTGEDKDAGAENSGDKPDDGGGVK